MTLQQHKAIISLFLFALLVEYAHGQQAAKTVQSLLLAKSNYAFTAVAWSPDGRYFASAWNMYILVWDSKDNSVATVCGGHTDRITSVSFSNNGNYMLSSSNDGSVIIYNLRNDYTAIKILPKLAKDGGGVHTNSICGVFA